MRRRHLATSLLLLPALVAPACGWKEEPLGARAERYPLTTPDATGRSVTVADPPQSVVSTDRAAGGVLRALRPTAEVRTLPDAGAAALQEARPDLLVVPDHADPPAGLPDEVPVFRYGAARFDALPAAVARLAMAVGRGPEGVRLASRLGRDLERVRVRGAAARRVRVFIDAGALQTVDPRRPLARAVTLAGGRLIRRQRGPVSIAQLRRFDPEIWLVLPASGTRLRLLRRDPATREIAAVRAGRVLRADESAYAPGLGLPAALDRLIDVLHAPAF